MNIVQITPGAGGMYCGNCFRDNALVAALRRMGHSTLMMPLYLPMTLEDADQSAGTPIFFSGINVYLENRWGFFRRAPNWLHRALASPRLLKWASGRAAKTRAEDVGELTLSMLRGEEGNQARELDELIEWLEGAVRPDVICLSNALLSGMIRQLRERLGVPVVCMMQGESAFLDALPPELRERAWLVLSERLSEADLFVAPSRYFGELMRERLNLPKERLRVVPNGIDLTGYSPAAVRPRPPVLGYWSRMCREKGVDMLVEAYIRLKERNRIPGLRLKVGGGLGPADEPLVRRLKRNLRQAKLDELSEFHPNLTREEKLEFLRSLTVLSAPALYGEAFGLYVIEALASGVPVVLPRDAAFPELIEATAGGVLCEGNADAFAEAIEALLLDEDACRARGEDGRRAVLEKFHVEAMAERMLQVFDEARAAFRAA